MKTELIKGVPRAAEEELAARQKEFARLSDLLAECEMELKELHMTLGQFAARYYRLVARKYVELDELLARIAERKAARNPAAGHFAADARGKRVEAKKSAGEYRAWEAEPKVPEDKVHVSGEGKKLYRKIAAQIHPDKAGDEKSRAFRTRLMTELNEAYSRGDIGKMRAILKNWQASPEAVAGQGTSVELVRLERIISRIKKKIAALEKDKSALRNSAMYSLMLEVRKARDAGRDLLAELAEELDRKINLAAKELADLG